MKRELLAPAGDIESGYAGLFYGADAVYLGLKQFSARASAVNFEEDTLNHFVGYAHHLGRKVYVTLNTLVQEGELSSLIESLDVCSRIGVDAIILQDIGAARIVRECYPNMEMHASTQMVVHNKAGALALQKMGFKRIVLARELSLPEIEEIASIPNLETECFIHGALCYSYSGLCMFSSLAFAKSANRGKCMYPCRSSFSFEKSKELHPFSMKDMALEDDILKLPITSFKIEGRKKNALYVAAVTDYYRRLLDGKPLAEDKKENIKQIFSRSWTKFHFNGKTKDVVDTEFVGHRGLFIGNIEKIEKSCIHLKIQHNIARYDGIQIDVKGQERPFGFSLQVLKVSNRNVYEAAKGDKVAIELPSNAPFLQKGDAVYLSSATKVKGAYHYEKPKPDAFKTFPTLDVKVEVRPFEVIAYCSLGNRVALKGEFSVAKNKDKTIDAIKDTFLKTGDRAFSLGNIEIENKDALFVPMSVLNNLRRDLYDKINIVQKEGKLPPISPKIEHKKPKWIIKTDDVSCLALLDLENIAEVILAVDTSFDFKDLNVLPRNKIRIALPPIARKQKEMERFISELTAKGLQKFEISGLWARELLPSKGLDISLDSTVYVLNSQAMEEAKSMGFKRVAFSLEDNLENIQCLAEKAPLPTVFILYQDVPLFISAVCIRENNCKACDNKAKQIPLLKAKEKYVAIVKDCQTMLFNDKPFCLAKEAPLVKADFYRLDFMHKKYSAGQVNDIFSKLLAFENIDYSLKGNMYRKL